jgi:hypothetical protein
LAADRRLHDASVARLDADSFSFEIVARRSPIKEKRHLGKESRFDIKSNNLFIVEQQDCYIS